MGQDGGYEKGRKFCKDEIISLSFRDTEVSGNWIPVRSGRQQRRGEFGTEDIRDAHGQKQASKLGS